MREQLARAFRAQVVRDFLDAVDLAAESERRDHPDGGGDFDVRAVARTEGDSLRLEMVVVDPVLDCTRVVRFEGAAPAGAMAARALSNGPAYLRIFRILAAIPDAPAADDAPDEHDYTPDDYPPDGYTPDPIGWYP
jgi:hypothetical protein